MNAPLSPQLVEGNLARIRAQIAEAAQRAGRESATVEILAAVKYLASEDLPALAQAGVELVGENRAQELERKVAAHPRLFSWHFIGQLQSRKVKQILPLVDLVHTVASDSVLEQLAKHGSDQTRVLVQVNVAGEAGKAGIAPEELADFIVRCPVPVVGLMTMPPATTDPEGNRGHFRALKQLADVHHLKQLSMGTSQDFVVAVEEGATIVRLGSVLYK